MLVKLTPEENRIVWLTATDRRGRVRHRWKENTMVYIPSLSYPKSKVDFSFSWKSHHKFTYNNSGANPTKLSFSASKYFFSAFPCIVN